MMGALRWVRNAGATDAEISSYTTGTQRTEARFCPTATWPDGNVPTIGKFTSNTAKWPTRVKKPHVRRGSEGGCLRTCRAVASETASPLEARPRSSADGCLPQPTFQDYQKSAFGQVVASAVRRRASAARVSTPAWLPTVTQPRGAPAVSVAVRRGCRAARQDRH